MERSLGALVVCVPAFLAGCGLTLDYDPPTDGGATKELATIG